MSLVSRSSFTFVSLLVALSACGTERSPAGSSGNEGRNTAPPAPSSDESPGLARALGSSFQRYVPSEVRPDPRNPAVRQKEPFFTRPWNAEFRTEHDGSLSAITQDESPANLPGAHFRDTAANQRLASRFPATAAGDLEVTVGDNPGAWIHERIASASGESRVQLSEGRVVYAGAKPGLDRIYEVSGQRVEEYLRLTDESALQQVAYEVAVGPAIADLVIDGSGHGLMAVDSAGKQVLKAPQPTGVDSQGHGVQGKLVAEKTSERHYRVRVILDSAGVSFPVLLDPSWVSAGSMGTTRMYHSAVRLPTGDVLVAGGNTGAGMLASAERYDSVSQSWIAVASMASTRLDHSATLLQNGNVLVVGGVDGTARLSSATLYNPADNTWSAATSMAVARQKPTATLLQDGKVLVVGGYDGTSSTASAEVYDPVGNSWIATPSMVQARRSHGASILSNGEVLVMGGSPDGNSPVASAERYVPASNTWNTTAPMTTPRQFFTATELQSGKILVAGGADSNDGLASSELYDPVSNAWTTGGTMPFFSLDHTATLLPSGKVMLVGGQGNSGVLSSALLYQPSNNSWSVGASMASKRYAHSATLLLSGNVLVAGGYNGTNALLSAELSFEPLANGSVCQAALSGNCESTFCVSGVCCDTSCPSGNGVCTIAQGASADGVCTHFANGTPCQSSSPGNCASGICADGVCCDTACPDGQGVCAASHGASANGTCTHFPNGTACQTSAPGNCASGHCVDGYCCNQPCTGGCDRCDIASSIGVCKAVTHGTTGTTPACGGYVCDGVSGACPSTCAFDADCSTGYACSPAGTCELKNGQACPGGPSTCVSGFCADGYCCNAACGGGGCDRCDLPGKVGVCTVASQGDSGNSPACTFPFVCDGIATSCATCTSDAGCAAGHYCAADGTCKAQKNQSDACNAQAGQDCHASGCRVCTTGQCVDGYCCDSACQGSCNACAFSMGASADGICTVVAQGVQGSPLCAPYVCNGASSNCPTACINNGDCSASAYCQGGTCHGSGQPGDPCIAGGQCASNNCVDGVCCNSACTGPCEACNESGHSGQCVPVSGQPRAPRLECAGAATDVCKGYCNGQVTTECTFPAQGTQCAAAQCEGDALAPARSCDGSGLCQPVVLQSCANFSCDVIQSQCRLTCSTENDCAAGFLCVGATCQAAGSLADGVMCSFDAQCESTHCVDGVCCDLVCSGTCQSCDGNYNVNGTGKCSPVKTKEDPRSDYTKDAANPCGAPGSCDGTGNCATFADPGATCGAKSCDGPSVMAKECDGFGNCGNVTDASCGAFACDPVTLACRTSCTTTQDCASGAICDANGVCSLGEATCQDATTAKAPNGTLSDCSPYRCLNGQCKATCSTAADCAPNATCDNGQCTTGAAGAGGTAGSAGSAGTSGTAGSSNPAAAPASGDSGGCSVPSGSRGSSGGVLVIAAVAAAVSRRRRAG